MAAYPVTFDASQPGKFDRVHIAIRLLIVIILSILGGAIGWVFGLIYLAVPVVAAIQISQKGSEGYLASAQEGMAKWLRFLVGFFAYLGLLTDRLPNENPDGAVRFEVRPGGTHTAGSALLRIILAIPSAIVLAIIEILAGLLTLIAAIMILVQETYPASIYGFLRATLRWHARLLAYLASLVAEYPPFAIDTEPETAPPAPAS